MFCNEACLQDDAVLQRHVPHTCDLCESRTNRKRLIERSFPCVCVVTADDLPERMTFRSRGIRSEAATRSLIRNLLID